MEHILVTGGAGYVGSHTCKALSSAGFRPVVYDNLSNGHEWAVKWGPLEKGNILDADRLRAVFDQYRPIAVMHFAALIEVGESVVRPAEFWETNVAGTLTLLQSMSAAGVDPLVFSSTCAIFGENESTLSEDLPIAPISPYARTKATIESMIEDLSRASGLRASCLRYFNAAGASADGEIGEVHDPETHLIPIACQAALGIRKEVVIYGEDYPTPDGTCIRDYVHVSDLATAHVLAMRRLLTGGDNRPFNLGTGSGNSVREVLETVARVSKVDFPIRRAKRRPGDSPRLVGDHRRAKAELGWSPRYIDLSTIVETAWKWHSAYHDT